MVKISHKLSKQTLVCYLILKLDFYIDYLKLKYQQKIEHQIQKEYTNSKQMHFFNELITLNCFIIHDTIYFDS